MARETAAAYAVETSADPARLTADLVAAVDAFSSAELDDWSVDELGDAALALETAQSRLVAAQGRLLADFDARQSPRADACLSTAAWLRHRTRLGAGGAQRRMNRVRQLARMPLLRAAHEAGAVSTEHVDAVVRLAGGARTARIAEHDRTLTDLAVDKTPREVGVAVRAIVDGLASDPDDDDPSAVCAAEELRDLVVRAGVFGLGELTGTLTPLLWALCERIRDVYDQPDADGIPPERRRSRGQRFHDAMVAALAAALDVAGDRASVDGVRAHVVVFCDLMTLLGRDDLAVLTPRLSATGTITPDVARHLLSVTDPTLRAALTLGPWRPVSVGRAQRTLPGWLRGALEAVHRHCRAPGCDPRFSRTEADHLSAMPPVATRPWPTVHPNAGRITTSNTPTAGPSASTSTPASSPGPARTAPARSPSTHPTSDHS